MGKIRIALMIISPKDQRRGCTVYVLPNLGGTFGGGVWVGILCAKFAERNAGHKWVG
jgi:hypothetical protein